MSYAIFRVEPIQKLKDLGQIGAHNTRQKEAYQSNPDIDIEKSKDNITLVPCSNYYQKYMKMVAPYKKQHEEKQKIERENRKKSFSQMLDDSNSVVADEMLFTSDTEFFKDMTKDEIIAWANCCMDFVYEDIGYKKEQILNAEIHMDETTPHLHLVVVPLIKKFDKRANEEKYTISKKQYIKDKLHLSKLQDLYFDKLNANDYDLDRGIKNSDNENLTIKEYKKVTRKFGNTMNARAKALDKAVKQFDEDIKTSKPTLVGDFIKVKKDTFYSMNKVVSETRKVLKEAPKMQNLIDDMSEFTTSYKSLDTKNKSIQKEVQYLKNRTQKLENENRNLRDYISDLVKALKKIFKKILHIGTMEEKDTVVEEVENYYDNEFYSKKDIVYIAKGTDKEDKLYEYADIDREYDDYDTSIAEDNSKDYDDFDIGM